MSETVETNKSALFSKHIWSMLIVVLMALSWLTPLDKYSKDYVDESLQQSLVSFAIARSLNAGISMAQSTEVSMVAASVDIGELLDPLNDLVEDFSTVMKWTSISLIIQKVILTLVSDMTFQIALMVVSLALLYDFYNPTKLRSAIRKLFLTVLALRFLVVLVVVLNSAVDELVIKGHLSAKLSEVDSVSSTQVEFINQQASEEGEKKAAAQKQFVELNSEVAKLEYLLNELRADKSQVEAQIEDEEEKLKGFVDKFKDLVNGSESTNSSNESEDEINANIAAKETELSSIESEISSLASQINVHQDLIDENNDIIEGSLLDGMTDKFSSMVDSFQTNFDVKVLKEKVESIAEDILYLMSLFVLRTIIFPLIFLYFGYLVFRNIWPNSL